MARSQASRPLMAIVFIMLSRWNIGLRCARTPARRPRKPRPAVVPENIRHGAVVHQFTVDLLDPDEVGRGESRDVALVEALIGL